MQFAASFCLFFIYKCFLLVVYMLKIDQFENYFNNSMPLILNNPIMKNFLCYLNCKIKINMFTFAS